MTQAETVSLREAGARLGVGWRAAREAADRGEIPTIKIGRRLLVPQAALDRLLAGHPAEAVR